MRNLILATLATAALAGCGADPVWAPDEDVNAVRYRDPGPARLTLYTMVSNETGSGGHSSLMINGSERVIFDPSGSFVHPSVPERNDVLFGVTPKIDDIYTRYHARKTWHVVVQEVDVSPEVAELALKLAKENGAVPNGYCASSTSRIIQRLPGFGGVKATMFPVKLENEFRKIAGVRESVLHEYDSDDNKKLLEAWDPERFARNASALAATKQAKKN